MFWAPQRNPFFLGPGTRTPTYMIPSPVPKGGGGKVSRGGGGPPFSFWSRPWVTFIHVSALYSAILVSNVGSPSPFFVLAPSLGHFFTRFRIIFPHFSVKCGVPVPGHIFPRFRIIFSHFCVKCGGPVPGPWVRVKGGGSPFFVFCALCSAILVSIEGPRSPSWAPGGGRGLSFFALFCALYSEILVPNVRSPSSHPRAPFRFATHYILRF